MNKNELYDAMDVANYIIKCSNEQEIALTNNILQRILYEVQKMHILCTPHEACFKDTIVACEQGVIIPTVYNAFKKFKDGYIPYILIDKYGDSNKLGDKTKDLIKFTVNCMCWQDEDELNRYLQNDDVWSNAYHRIITIDAIKNEVNI